jgi:hypothetical protein
MKLIDRYVAEVGKRLPLVKGRKDIENELRSTLEDMLDDRAKKSGNPSDEAMEIELLKDYGAPQKVAETYNPTPYLIGPRMFPLFIMILKIVVAAVTLAMTIVTGIEIATHSPMTAVELLKLIGEGLLNIVSASIAAFGNIALVFALIERFAPISKFSIREDKEWDPASLMIEAEPEDIKVWEPIAAMVFTFIAISIFNFNPQLIGIYTLTGNKWSVVPIFSAAFFRWLPLMNIAWIAEIILNGMLLKAGRWQTGTRVVSIIIKSLQIVIGYFLLTGPSIIAITTETLNSIQTFDAEAARILGAMAQQGPRGLIALVMFITAIDIVNSGYKLITQKASSS